MSTAAAEPTSLNSVHPADHDDTQLTEMASQAKSVRLDVEDQVGDGSGLSAAGYGSVAVEYNISATNTPCFESDCEYEDEEHAVWTPDSTTNPNLAELGAGKQRVHLDMIKEGTLEWWGLSNPTSEDLTSVGAGFNEGWCGEIPKLPTSPQTRQFGLFSAVRRLSSQQRQRFEWDGFDLDLTYVTTRIIAMGFPAQGAKIAWQNPHSEVSRFLYSRHEAHFRIWNLCGEDSHCDNGFPGHTVRYPCADHCPPSLIMMHAFCCDVEAWLGADKEHVAVIHCKAGKGRTGSMICALLLYSRALPCAYEALKFYGAVRGGKRAGVTIPSQIRWIAMFEHWLQHRALGLSSDPMGASPMLYRLRSVSFGPVIDSKELDSSTVVIEVGLTTRDQIARAGLPKGVVHWYEEVTVTSSGSKVIEVPLPDCGPIWVENDGLLIIVAKRFYLDSNRNFKNPIATAATGLSKSLTSAFSSTLRFWAWWHHAFLQKRVSPSGHGHELLLDLPASYIDGMQRGGSSKEWAAADFRLKAIFEEISPVDTSGKYTDKTASKTKSLAVRTNTLSSATGMTNASTMLTTNINSSGVGTMNTLSSVAGMSEHDQPTSLRWLSDVSQESQETLPDGAIASLGRSKSISSGRRQVMI